MIEKVLMENMTWREIEEALKSDKDTAIVVAGSVEQHGPHMPTSTDTSLGYAMAEGIAKKLGNALVAPVIRPGLSEFHVGFPGTFTLTIDTFVRLLYEYCESLVISGFKNICIIPSHGGNSDAIMTYIPRIAKQFADKATIFAIPIGVYTTKVREYLTKQGISRVGAHSRSKGEVGMHAGYDEASMMLHIKPEIMRMDWVEKGLAEEELFQPTQRRKLQIKRFVLGYKKLTPNGIVGDPREASAKVGKELMRLIVDLLVEEIETYLGKPNSIRKK